MQIKFNCPKKGQEKNKQNSFGNFGNFGGFGNFGEKVKIKKFINGK